ncbi:MAG: ribonuclease Z [Oscillospiraceae bacterium]|nr:ribonuclease Z [Oscillospiraceae bacterium]
MPEITLLGTGGMLPLKNRFLTSLYYEQNGQAILIDCGEGTQVAFAQHGLKLSRISAICLTHLHADHVTGLPGLLLSLGNTGRQEMLPIYCGTTTVMTVKHLLYVTGGLPFDVKIIPLNEKKPQELHFTDIDPLLTVRTLPLSHQAPCLGYQIELGKKPEFLPDKAKALEVPVQFYRTLHSGEDVWLPDGRFIKASDVTGPPRLPLKVTYTTDTLPILAIADFAKDSDLFICEGMWGSEERKDSMNEKKHMLMQDACRLAVKAKAKRLWLTHYSPAEKDPHVYEEELQMIYPGVNISKDGEHISL